MSAPDFSASVRRLLDDDGRQPGPLPKHEPSRPIFGTLPVRQQPPASPAAAAHRGPEVGGRPSDLRPMSPSAGRSPAGRQRASLGGGERPSVSPRAADAPASPRPLRGEGPSLASPVVPRALRRAVAYRAALGRAVDRVLAR